MENVEKTFEKYAAMRNSGMKMIMDHYNECLNLLQILQAQEIEAQNKPPEVNTSCQNQLEVKVVVNEELIIKESENKTEINTDGYHQEEEKEIEEDEPTKEDGSEGDNKGKISGKSVLLISMAATTKIGRELVSIKPIGESRAMTGIVKKTTVVDESTFVLRKDTCMIGTLHSGKKRKRWETNFYFERGKIANLMAQF